ncbi:MAG TPA: hypothetical protein VJN71_01690 [Nitrososphaerales archaeon]|nr:hypothetical protein [Nitrososphaerales archaeon]
MSEESTDEAESGRRMSVEVGKRDNALTMEIERSYLTKSYAPADTMEKGVRANIGSLNSQGFSNTKIAKVSVGKVRPLFETHVASFISERERQVDRFRIMVRK